MNEIEAVFFDAGDTLMRLSPDYTGPMIYWPELTPVSGIAETLVALSGRFKLAVLSNAEDSTLEEVRAALRRVGLDAFFPTILISRDAGVQKPDPAYFRLALERVGALAGKSVMVGDYYEVDVVGAKNAGLKAVWYNPELRPCPETHPQYDAEMRDMRDLPAILGANAIQDQPGYGRVSEAVRGLGLPDVKACEAWLREEGSPEELLVHVRLVAGAAFRLAEQLRAQGERVDPLLVHRAGLLHDVAKVSSQGRGVSHEAEGARLLRERGFEALARITERHPVWAPLTDGLAPETWEEKLVYYADRIAEAEGIISIDERMAAMLKRHPERSDDVQIYAAAARAVEGEIAGKLGLRPDEVVARVRELLG